MPGRVPTSEEIAVAEDPALLELYTEVMGELMVRHRVEHRDHWGSERDLPGPLAELDDSELQRMYHVVHDEMMRRHEERPPV